jgi:hypothetical protein
VLENFWVFVSLSSPFLTNYFGDSNDLAFDEFFYVSKYLLSMRIGALSRGPGYFEV